MKIMPEKKCRSCMVEYPDKLFSQNMDNCIYCFKKSGYVKDEKDVFVVLVKELQKKQIKEHYAYLYHKYYFIYEQFGISIFTSSK